MFRLEIVKLMTKINTVNQLGNLFLMGVRVNSSKIAFHVYKS